MDLRDFSDAQGLADFITNFSESDFFRMRAEITTFMENDFKHEFTGSAVAKIVGPALMEVYTKKRVIRRPKIWALRLFIITAIFLFKSKLTNQLLSLFLMLRSIIFMSKNRTRKN